MIRFDFLPSAAAITTLAADQLRIDGLGLQSDSRRESIHQGQKGPAVRFTGGQIA